MRKLLVHRKAYCKRGYARKAYRRKGGIKVPATKVKPHCIPHTRFYIKDIGAVGRSRMPAGMRPLKKGRMTYAVGKALGYEKRPSELTGAEWRRVFERSGITGRSWLGMLATQVARRRFAKEPKRAEAKEAFQKAIAILKEERKGELVPVEAIRKRMLKRVHKVI
jgi:hypothetical protein